MTASRRMKRASNAHPVPSIRQDKSGGIKDDEYQNNMDGPENISSHTWKVLPIAPFSFFLLDAHLLLHNTHIFSFSFTTSSPPLSSEGTWTKFQT